MSSALSTFNTRTEVPLSKWKWKWRDIRPSMVTHTRNLCSAFNPSKVHTHSSEHTHTHTPLTHTQQWTHTRSSGQPFMLRRPGSIWGFGALLKGTSVVVLKVERVLYIHSPHLQFLPVRDSNSQPLDYESDSLTIRPRLPREAPNPQLLPGRRSIKGCHCSGCVFTVCVCVHCCVCVLRMDKCRALIPSMGYHTWPYVTFTLK